MEGVTPYRWLTWSTLGTVRIERQTPKDSTCSSTTGGKPSLGRSPLQMKSRRSVDYRATGTENNECRRYTIPSWLTPIRADRSNPGTVSTPEARCPYKEWRPQPDRLSVNISPPSSLMTQNRAGNASIRLSRSWPVPSTSTINWGNRGGSGLTMTVRGRSYVSRKRHRIPRGICLGELPITWAWSDVQRQKWKPRVAPKGAVLVIPTFPIFWGPLLDPFRFFMVWPSSAQGGPKYRPCLGSARIQLSWTIIWHISLI